jgi:signal transduction histidine kinase
VLPRAIGAVFERVTGSYIFTLRTFLIFSLFGPVGVAVTIPRGDISLSERGEWLLVGVLAELALGFYMLAISHSILPRVQRRVSPLLTTVLLIALGGALRGVVINLAPAIFGLEDDIHIFLRALSSTITITVAMLAIGFIIEGQERYIQEYQDLYRRFLLLKRERQIYITIKPAERLSEVALYIQKVTATLKGRLDAFDETEINDEDAASVAEDIKQIIEKRIRPLSHRLWLDRSNHVLRFKLNRLIVDALLARQVPYIAITFTYCAAYFVGIAIPEGLPIALGAIIPSGFVFWLLLYLEDILRDRHLVLGKWLHPVVLILVAVAPTLISIRMIEMISDQLPNAYVVWLFVTINPLLTMLITIINQIFADRAKILELLDKSVTDDLLEEHLHTLAKINQDSEIATYLHGSLQAELTAIALQLQQAATSGDAIGVRKMVKMAQIVINRDISEDFISHESSPIDKLEDFARAWQGIADVTLALGDTEQYSLDFLSDVAQLVEEAVSSAVRFGLATQVAIQGRREGNYFHLTISDDGRNKKGGGLGLGSQILDELAPELWRRKFMDHGTVLDIHLPAHGRGARER